MDYLAKFYKWMLQKGRLDRDGYPAEGLSTRTANNKLKKIRRILVELGYIKKEQITRNNFRYSYWHGKSINNLSVKEIEKWFSKEFPMLVDAKARYRKADYVDAVYKFCEFLHYEAKIWGKEKLLKLKATIRRPQTPPVWENKVEILPVERIDSFLEHLKSISPTHYTMFYLMRHAGMRYIEVINIKADLKSGTLQADFENNMIIIHGKGRGGLSQIRRTPFFKDDQQVVMEYLKWREQMGIKSDWLFVTKHGKKWSEQSGHFNEWLKEQGKKYGFSNEEIKLLTTHKVGRHAYCTNATIKGLPEQFIRENMGIRNPRILERYQNATDKIRVGETEKKLKGSKFATILSSALITNKERKRRLVDMLINKQISQDTFLIAINSLHRHIGDKKI